MPFGLWLIVNSKHHKTSQLHKGLTWNGLDCLKIIFLYEFRVLLRKKRKIPLQSLYQWLQREMVEMGGSEPPSESTLTGTSPGADDYLHSLIHAGNVTLMESVASWCVERSKLCELTFTTSRRPIPGRGTPGWNARYYAARRTDLLLFFNL